MTTTSPATFQILKAILEKHGGMEALKKEVRIKIKSRIYSPLLIEYRGTLNVGDLISFAHTYEQNGDLMYDPEVVFVIKDGAWEALSYRQDSIFFFSDISVLKKGKLVKRTRPYRKFCAFMKRWEENLIYFEFLSQ